MCGPLLMIEPLSNIPVTGMEIGGNGVDVDDSIGVDARIGVDVRTGVSVGKDAKGVATAIGAVVKPKPKLVKLEVFNEAIVKRAKATILITNKRRCWATNWSREVGGLDGKINGFPINSWMVAAHTKEM